MTQQPPSGAQPEPPADQPEPPADQPEPAEQAGSREPPGQPELPTLPATGAPPPPPSATPVAGAPAPTGPPAAPPRKRRTGLILGIAGAVVLLALLGVGILVAVALLDEEVPQVGDCMSQAQAADQMEIVGCDSAEAYWSVIGSHGSLTRGEFDAAEQGTLCEDFPETEQALWVTGSRSVDAGTSGEVVCLAPVDPDAGEDAAEQ